MLKKGCVDDLKSGALSRSDGVIVLPMCHYPRGMSKARVDEYVKALGPSKALLDDFHAERELFLDRFNDERRPMAKEAQPESERDVHVFVTVHIPNLRTLRARGDDRIDHLLPQVLEARRRSRIGEMRAMFLSSLLRARRAFRVTCDQRVEVFLLPLGQPTLRPDVNRLERAKIFLPARRCFRRRRNHDARSACSRGRRGRRVRRWLRLRGVRIRRELGVEIRCEV